MADGPHATLHQVYMEIFKLMYGETKVGWLKSLFVSKQKRKEENKKKAEELMQNLISISESLLESITMLEQEVMSMSDEEIQGLY